MKNWGDVVNDWRTRLNEDYSSGSKFYHGTTEEAAGQILRSGFDVGRAGARQKALHGKDQPEVRGVYLTPSKERAKWYAGKDIASPGRGGGAIVEVSVSGRILPEKDWWRLKREIREEWDLQLYDPRAQEAVEEAVNRAKSQGYVGFVEMERPDPEIVVFSPANVKVVGAYDARWVGSRLNEGLRDELEDRRRRAELDPDDEGVRADVERDQLRQGEDEGTQKLEDVMNAAKEQRYAPTINLDVDSGGQFFRKYIIPAIEAIATGGDHSWYISQDHTGWGHGSFSSFYTIGVRGRDNEGRLRDFNNLKTLLDRSDLPGDFDMEVKEKGMTGPYVKIWYQPVID